MTPERERKLLERERRWHAVRERFRMRLAQHIAEKQMQSQSLVPAPRYDAVYWDGLAWLDELARR